MAIKLTSPSFHDGGIIPDKHTCEGPEYPPALSWENVPNGTKSLAITVDDPDAPGGIWDHWVLFNLPPDLTGFIEDVEGAQGFPDGTKQGVNSWGKIGWGGPCPPDREHRYYFRIYALDQMLPLPSKATKPQLQEAMRGHILDQGELMGRYDRKRR